MNYQVKFSNGFVSNVGIYTTEDIARIHRGYFFKPDTMKFFKSRLSSNVYHGSGVVFFVTSETGPQGLRGFTVRKYLPNSDDVVTAGEFMAFKTLGKAKAAARVMAASTIDKNC